MAATPLVSIIIPHYNGKEILHACLLSLRQTEYREKEIILVNNASTDDSLDNIDDLYPGIKIINNKVNLGYAGGCNVGAAAASGAYLVFLNNDTTHEPDWLSIMVQYCEHDNAIAACQPKILNQTHPHTFDYAGGAGGLLDVLGYPFAKGRIFFTVEKDTGQYDQEDDIFWASGTALLVRSSVLDEVGLFDEDFFAHMEEIDLCWRLHLKKYRVVVTPRAVVYHNAGSTLKPDSPRKLYLNHRNSLMMILKNYRLHSLLWIFPIRLLLEFFTMVYAIFELKPMRLRAVVKGLFGTLFNFPKILKKRKTVAKLRQVTDTEIFQKMYRGSITFDYFIRGIRSAAKLKL